MGRPLIIAVGTFALVVCCAGPQARSDQQQWCAYFTGGPTKCGFKSFAQCLDAIRGKTALCQLNAGTR